MSIRVDDQAADRLVTLDRPDKRNAIDADMVAARHGVCDRLERKPRLLLLTGGTAGVFAAGADIAQLRDRRRLDALAEINSALFARIRALPLPTVAAWTVRPSAAAPSWRTPATCGCVRRARSSGNPRCGWASLLAPAARTACRRS